MEKLKFRAFVKSLNKNIKQFDYFGKMNECEIIGNAYTGEL